MASNLTKTTKSVKKLLIFFLVFIVIIILADYFIKSTSPITPPGDTTNSKYYPIKNEIFSKIPYPQIKGLTVANPTKIKVSKDTVKFPEFPPVLNIYKLKPEQEHLNEANQAREIAKTLELTSGESKIINNVIYFETINADRVFSFDKAQRLWNYRIKSLGINALGLKEIEKYKTAALSFMSSMQLNSGKYFEIDYTEGYITYLDNQGNYTSLTTNNANSARILLNKKILAIQPTTEKVPTLYSTIQRPNSTDSIASMTIINKGEKIYSDMYSFSYKAHDYETNIGIYPILSAAEAFEKIQNDGGYLFSMVEKNGNVFQNNNTQTIMEFKLTVNSTKLIYIEAETISSQEPWTQYLQPFYKFSGQAKSTYNKDYLFSFIVPALADASYSGL